MKKISEPSALGSKEIVLNKMNALRGIEITTFMAQTKHNYTT
jgi:hypothetical protein